MVGLKAEIMKRVNNDEIVEVNGVDEITRFFIFSRRFISIAMMITGFLGGIIADYTIKHMLITKTMSYG